MKDLIDTYKQWIRPYAYFNLQLVFGNIFTQSRFLLLSWNQQFLEEIPVISQEEEIHCQLLSLQLRAYICFAHYWRSANVQLVSFTLKGLH